MCILLKSIELKISLCTVKRTKEKICIAYSYINSWNPMERCFKVNKEDLTSFENI